MKPLLICLSLAILIQLSWSAAIEPRGKEQRSILNEIKT